MTDRRIRSLVILGGGTAGWMAAAALCRSSSGMNIRLRLIEAARIEPIGVGEGDHTADHGLHPSARHR